MLMAVGGATATRRTGSPGTSSVSVSQAGSSVGTGRCPQLKRCTRRSVLAVSSPFSCSSCAACRSRSASDGGELAADGEIVEKTTINSEQTLGGWSARPDQLLSEERLEVGQHRRRLLFGQQVAAIQRLACYVVGLRPPRIEHVPEVAHRALGTPQG